MNTANSLARSFVPPSGFWGHQLDAADCGDSWLWHGYLAPGQVAMLISQWKCGKTTLLSVLLARFKTGGVLAGLPVAATKAIVVSEESRPQWQPRQRKFDLSQVYFICRPFAGKPTHEQWIGLLNYVAELRRQHGFGLLAIDTISRLLPAGSESNADACHKALDPLERLTEAGMSVLLAHHPAKGRTLAGQAGRGAGAFGGIADVTIEMGGCPGAGKDDRRRRLLGYSRSPETPSQLVIELNAEATDYAVREALAADDLTANWHPLRLVLEDAHQKLDRRQIHAAWPDDYPRPNEITLWRWLDHAAELGLVRRQGSGHKSDAFRYWLPYVEEQFRKLNPGYDIGELAEAKFRQFLAERDARWQGARRDPDGSNLTRGGQEAIQPQIAPMLPLEPGRQGSQPSETAPWQSA